MKRRPQNKNQLFVVHRWRNNRRVGTLKKWWPVMFIVSRSFWGAGKIKSCLVIGSFDDFWAHWNGSLSLSVSIVVVIGRFLSETNKRLPGNELNRRKRNKMGRKTGTKLRWKGDTAADYFRSPNTCTPIKWKIRLITWLARHVVAAPPQRVGPEARIWIKTSAVASNEANAVNLEPEKKRTK